MRQDFLEEREMRASQTHGGETAAASVAWASGNVHALISRSYLLFLLLVYHVSDVFSENPMNR